MNIYELDGKNMLTRADAHREIAEKMAFPDYYGGNLDALWDMLGGFRGKVLMHNTASMLAALDAYGAKILTTFFEAEEDNDGFCFEVVD